MEGEIENELGNEIENEIENELGNKDDDENMEEDMENDDDGENKETRKLKRLQKRNEERQRVLQEFEDDLNTISTPRLRLIEAQVFTQQGDEVKRVDEDDADILENMIEQNKDEVDVEIENQLFLRELNSAIEDIQKWKDRSECKDPEFEDDQKSEDFPQFESKFDRYVIDEVEIQSRYADDKKIHSLEELLHSPRYVNEEDNDKMEDRRLLSENLVRMRRLEEEVRTNDLLESQLAESKVLEEGMVLANDLNDLEKRLRLYNDDLDRILSGGRSVGEEML